LIGMALGIPNKKLGIGKEFVAMAPTPLAVETAWGLPRKTK